MWSKERIWEWYNNRPWIRGCNFMSSDCANRIDQWQSYGFEERMKTTDEELRLASETGFNSIRILIEYFVWKEEHDSFMERFDRYLDICDKHGISCMVVLANDCVPPDGYQWELGEQSFDIGYHGGKKRSQHGSFDNVPPHYLDDPKTAEDYYKMVREIVTKYKDDERIIIWDVYNEPGNSNRKNKSLPYIKKMFEIIREIDPIQPLTLGAFTGKMTEVEKFGLENSDIISYHCYADFSTHIKQINDLKKYGRPIINTEWLARGYKNDVFDNFPVFFLEKIGCYNWGLVAGKYQTFEPWDALWSLYDNNKKLADEFDFTKWFHDLYRPNHRPYDPKEIDLIKDLCQLSDKEYNEK